LRTNTECRPDGSMEMSWQAENEIELALLCFLRTTTPEWDDDPATENILRLTFRSAAEPLLRKTEQQAKELMD
jgi:hypothetical protein